MISKSQLKYIQSLGQKKHRDEAGVFIAEGPKLVRELLQDRHTELKYLYALQEWIELNEMDLSSSNVTEIAETELEKISLLKTPNQVFAVFKQREVKEPSTKGKITLVLDGVQDPGNIGTIIRIADWFAISHIVCSRDCADHYNPKTVQATMGSVARVQVFYTDLTTWLKQQTTRIYAALLEGEDVTRMKPLNEALIIIGNESRGIRAELLPYVNDRITIPKKGQADSLNAAVATGIILSHLT